MDEDDDRAGETEAEWRNDNHAGRSRLEGSRIAECEDD